ncbi:hypothetical protein SK128_028414, partial [Halocaridina rubra]
MRGKSNATLGSFSKGEACSPRTIWIRFTTGVSAKTVLLFPLDPLYDGSKREDCPLSIGSIIRK